MKYRAIQKITKGDKVIMPGEYIDEHFTKDELKEYADTGFAVVKIEVEKKPPPPPKAKGKGKKK